jgi:hypothetical protein
MDGVFKVAELANLRRPPIQTQRRVAASQPPGVPPTSSAKLPKITSSLPASNLSAITQRAEANRQSTRDRLYKTARLEKFMPLIRGNCPCCFVLSGDLTEHKPFEGCPGGAEPIPSDWLSFKAWFKGKFLPYCYCYNCGFPQDRHGNRESPDCHRGIKFGKGNFCPWADFSFIVVWCLWHHPRHRSALLSNFGLKPSLDYSEFIEWAVTEEVMHGEYHKALEVFLWYCEIWLATGKR